jgi:hypothetical protein
VREPDIPHLERETGNAAQCLGHRQNLLRHRTRVANEQCTIGAALGIEAGSAGGAKPPSLPIEPNISA